MKEQRMNAALLEAFPELKDEFNEYISWQDGLDTGAFLTYEDIFLPRIVEALNNNEIDFLKRSADFIEKEHTQEDEYAANVIYVGVLEGLKAKCEERKIRAFLHGTALKDFDSLTY